MPRSYDGDGDGDGDDDGGKGYSEPRHADQQARAWSNTQRRSSTSPAWLLVTTLQGHLRLFDKMTGEEVWTLREGTGGPVIHHPPTRQAHDDNDPATSVTGTSSTAMSQHSTITSTSGAASSALTSTMTCNARALMTLPNQPGTPLGTFHRSDGMGSPMYIVEPIGPGYLYLHYPDEFDRRTGSAAATKPLVLSIAQFVANSPFQLLDGSLYLGNKVTRLLAIDIRTGRLLRAYDHHHAAASAQRKHGESAENDMHDVHDDGVHDDDAPNDDVYNDNVHDDVPHVDDPQDTELGHAQGLIDVQRHQDADTLHKHASSLAYDPRYTMLIGRTDYTVTVYAPGSLKPTWNVTYSEFTSASMGYPTTQHDDESRAVPENTRVYVDAQGNMTAVDSITDRILWHRDMNTHLTSAFDVDLQRRPSTRDTAEAEGMVRVVRRDDFGYESYDRHRPHERPADLTQVVRIDVDPTSDLLYLLPMPASSMPGASDARPGEQIGGTWRDRLVGTHVLTLPAAPASSYDLAPSLDQQMALTQGRLGLPAPATPESQWKTAVSMLLLTLLSIASVLYTLWRRRRASRRQSSHEATSKPTDDTKDGLQHIKLTKKVIGYGSQGTVVFQGSYQGHDVAVKRLIHDFFHVASQEVSLLRQSDWHPNVIRYYCWEQCSTFSYIALELCKTNLHQLVDQWSQYDRGLRRRQQPNATAVRHLVDRSEIDQGAFASLRRRHGNPPPGFANNSATKGLRLNGEMSDATVTQASRRAQRPPSDFKLVVSQTVYSDALHQNRTKSDDNHESIKTEGTGETHGITLHVKKVLMDMTQGLAHLHRCRIIHRDLKPANILISPQGRILISDFGLCKRLTEDGSSIMPTVMPQPKDDVEGRDDAPGLLVGGTQGWRAPEMLRLERRLLDHAGSQTVTPGTPSTNSKALFLGEDEETMVAEEEDINPDGNIMKSNATQDSATSRTETSTVASSITNTKSPEERISRSVDVFALGCIFYHVLTLGKHPFGDRYNRDANIVQGKAMLNDLPSPRETYMMMRQEGRALESVGTMKRAMGQAGEGNAGPSAADSSSSWRRAPANLTKTPKTSDTIATQHGTKSVMKKPALYQLPDGFIADDDIVARHLIQHMICPDPRKRYTANRVIGHPYFWNAQKRLTFLTDLSDYLESEPRGKSPTRAPAQATSSLSPSTVYMPPARQQRILEQDQHRLRASPDGQGHTFGHRSPRVPYAQMPGIVTRAIEAKSVNVFENDWRDAFERPFRNGLGDGKYRQYLGHSLRDLLRAIRNKKHHYQDLDMEAKRLVGDLPDGYLNYFVAKFPYLFMYCYDVAEIHLSKNATFKDSYFKSPSDMSILT